MLRKSLLFVLLFLFILPTIAQDEIRQWASSAAATSQYGDDAWSPQQATGEPDTEDCEDAQTAWAALEQNSSAEELVVYFDEPVIPTEINIYQNFGRGSIQAVELIRNEDGDRIRLRGTRDDDKECPGVFTISIDSVGDAVIGVAIQIDQSELEQWNEIDAVELVGAPTGEAANFSAAGSNENSNNNNSTNNSNNNNSSNSGLPFGRTVNCEDGGTFNNGLEFTVIQMRARSTYTVTAIGIGDFDPILAVLLDSGQGLCNDDSYEASFYGASLPTTGDVYPSDRSAQVVFTNRPAGQSFRNITFVVGGRNDQPGEFVLVLEGMTLMYEDGIGDPFSAYVAPAMVASGVPLTAYMVSITEAFDPWIGLVDNEMNFLRDDNKNYFACDDGGTNSCWGDSTSLEGFAISRSEGRALAGGYKDAMLSIPMDSSLEGAYINYVMSTIQGTYGDYMIAFHAGIGQ